MQNRDGELIGVVPVPEISDDIGEVTQRAPECMHARVGEQIVDIAVPLIFEKIVEMIQLVPLERIKDQIVEQIVEQIVAVLVSQIKEDIVEVTKPVLHERVQNRVGEQTVDLPLRQIKESGLQLVPQERMQNRTRKLFLDVPVPHIKEKIAGKVKCWESVHCASSSW